MATGLAGAATAAAVALSIPSAQAAGLVPWSETSPPAFELPQLGAPSTATISPAGQSGDAILVHFFASWCEPCREELPALKRLSERGAPRLKVVAVAVADNESRLRRVADEAGVTFPIAMDRERAVARAWSISALPSTVILDSQHRARLIVESDFDWDRIEPQHLIDRLSPQDKNVTAHQKNVTQGGQ